MEKKKKNPSQLFIPISFLLLFSALPSSSHYLTSFSSSSKTDAEALLLFKNSITQDPDGFLSNWQLNKSPCSWHGVNCTMGRVTKLDLSRCNLAGTLTFHPLSSLDMLTVLNLSVNRFSVNATESLLQLPAGLQTLDLSATGLVGTFPDGFIPKYTDIVYIYLSHNNLTGWLPDYLLANAGEKLQILDLSFNNFTGSIAGLKIGDNCKNLLDFDLSTNHLIDAIPYSLSNCTSLRSLNLSFNALMGEIPQTLGGLKSLQMLDLSLSLFFLSFFHSVFFLLLVNGPPRPLHQTL